MHRLPRRNIPLQQAALNGESADPSTARPDQFEGEDGSKVRQSVVNDVRAAEHPSSSGVPVDDTAEREDAPETDDATEAVVTSDDIGNTAPTEGASNDGTASAMPDAKEPPARE